MHVFAAGTFDLGRERVSLESGEEINVYSPERSVVDAVRMRGRVGTDVTYENSALKACVLTASLCAFAFVRAGLSLQ